MTKVAVILNSPNPERPFTYELSYAEAGYYPDIWAGHPQMDPELVYCQWDDGKRGQLVGMIWNHYKPVDGSPCRSALAFVKDPARPEHTTWTVFSLAPLSISPSVACAVCGEHGNIVDDTWQQAAHTATMKH